MERYVVDPESIELHQFAAWTALAATFLISIAAVVLRGRRAWLVVGVCALVVPTVSTFPFGGRPEWMLSYLTEAILPLAVGVGIPASVTGTIAGFALRWLWTRLPPGGQAT
jgi:hypothetical protein